MPAVNSVGVLRAQRAVDAIASAGRHVGAAVAAAAAIEAC